LPRLARGFPRISYKGIEAGVLYFESIELPDGSPGRAVALSFRPPRPERGPELPPPGGLPGFELVLAQASSHVHDALAALRQLLAIAWVGASLGCALLVTWVVRRGLRPLDRLRTEIDGLDAEELDRSVELDDAPAELRPVVDELNDLLARLRRAFERERSFSADVAHELRTPLAGLRSTLEVYLDRPRDAEQGRRTADRCLAITIEMQGVVEVLLEMAARSGGAEVRREAVPLAEAVSDCWAPVSAQARERGISLTSSIAAELEVETDAALLRRILTNLLENAVLYGDEGAAVEVSAPIADGSTRVTVENRASDAPAEAADHAFEAFWRADSARRDTGRHAGLGLPLCRKIAARLGARLAASLVEGRFSVTLSLPREE